MSQTQEITPRYPRPVPRSPRPVKRHPRNPFENDEQFCFIIEQLRPYLLMEADKIIRPSYIDSEDLVQEAILKLLKFRNFYNSTRGASMYTWAMNVARKQYYNVAITEGRQKRVPDNYFYAFLPMEEELVGNISTDFFSPEDELYYNELIERTNIRLRGLAKKIFEALLEPPEELINEIKEDIKNKQETPHKHKIPKYFTITSKRLAEHFEVPYHKIVQAKDKINDAMMRAMHE